MSIQIVVATPLAFYTNYLQSNSPVEDVQDFYIDLGRHAELALSSDRRDAVFFDVDLSISSHSKIYDVIRENERSLLTSYDADLFIPKHFEGKRAVNLTKLTKSGIVKVVSTYSLLSALQRIDLNIASWCPDREAELRQELSVYRNAISVSNEQIQPIFFSY